MNPIPSDPLARHDRFMAALNEDLLAGDRNYPRAKAVVEIAKQTRKEGDKR